MLTVDSLKITAFWSRKEPDTQHFLLLFTVIGNLGTRVGEQRPVNAVNPRNSGWEVIFGVLGSGGIR